MKKIVIGSLMVLVLLLVGAVGVANAEEKHQEGPVNKLVGFAGFGTLTSDPTVTQVSQIRFTFVNPDDTLGITINKVSIWRNCGINPEIVYEGPYISVWREDGNIKRAILNRPMRPHEFFSIFLNEYMYTGLGSDPDDPTETDDWMDVQAALDQGFSPYVVEIKWTSQGSNILIGHQGSSTKCYYNSGPMSGHIDIVTGGLQMFNIMQKDR